MNTMVDVLPKKNVGVQSPGMLDQCQISSMQLFIREISIRGYYFPGPIIILFLLLGLSSIFR